MALLVAAACTVLYGRIGFALASTPVFSRDNYLFHSDPHRVIGDLADSNARYDRTRVHPIFVLLFNPIGSTLRRLLGSVDAAAIVLNALCGGLAAGAALLVFLALGLGPSHALAYATLVALSASHLVYGSVPEVYIFAAASLIVLVLVTVRRPRSLWPYLAAGLLATGIIITNVVQAAILFFFGRDPDGGFLSAVRRTTAYVVMILAAAAVLSGVQKIVYPTSRFFLTPSTLIEEESHVPSYDEPMDVVDRAEDFMNALFLFDIVAPRPDLRHGPAPPASPRPVPGATPPPIVRQLPWATFIIEPDELDGAGIAAAALWGTLVLYAGWTLIRTWRQGRDAPLKRALLGCLLFNFALYMAYGHEPFQYSGNWTFTSIALVAVSLRPVHASGGRRAFLLDLVLAALVPLQLVANLAFVRALIEAYR